MEVAEVKIEESESAAGASGSASASLSHQPVEALYDLGVPPFLVKTFEMVEDSSMDSVISWSKAKNSFIIWDPHKLSADFLPRYFKHSNFSSFVRQLNTYGFRKVDPDRYEFANEGFLGGQKHLLKTIKRRRNVTQNMPQQSRDPCVELGHYGVEEEIQRLKRDRNLLMAEIVKLKQQHHNSRERIMFIEEQLRVSEKKQLQIMSFVAKAFGNPLFVRQYVDNHAKTSDQSRVELGQKRSLTMNPGTENDPTAETDSGNQDHEEMETLISAALDEESSSIANGPSSLATLTDDILEKFLGEDVLADNVAVENVDADDLVRFWGEDLDDFRDHLDLL